MRHHKNYDDIIHLPHHVSKVHPKMSTSDRAAQFSPFAALTGHQESIQETARLTEQKLELDDNQKTIIRQHLNDINDHIKLKPKVSIVYFQEDGKKSGGSYIELIDHIIKLDDYQQYLILQSGQKIMFKNIYSIDIH